MKILLPICLIVMCCQPGEHQPSIKDRLEGMWHSDPIAWMGDTALWEMYAIFEQEHYSISRIVVESDSGLYQYLYRDDSELIEVKPYQNLMVTEYVFHSDDSGTVYHYELDTVAGPIEVPRPREASQVQFKIKHWGSIYRLVCTTDELKSEVQLRFVDDDQHILAGKGSNSIFKRVK